MIEDAPFESLTKLEAAKRQLRVAIRLFFKRKDLVAVHALAAAAQGILGDLGKHKGVKGIFARSERIRPEYREEVIKSFKEVQNFFKHAAKDPDVNLKFYYDATKFYLFDAAVLYSELAGRQFPEVSVLIAWFISKFPNLLVDGALKEWITRKMPPEMNPDDFDALLAGIDLLEASSQP
jgi:hypothetical protein